MLLSKFLDPKNDVSFRRIFGTEKNKDILIHFINDMLELEGSNKIEEVTFLSPIQDPELASKKESIVDVLCKDASGVQMIVEMQVAPKKGFEKRAQYYASKAYCSQLNRGQELQGQYQNLKEVIFIAIVNYVLFPQKEHYKSDHILLDRITHDHDLKDFYYTFIELPKFGKKVISEMSSMVEKWVYFFKNAKETEEKELEELIGSDQVLRRAYEELDRFNWSETDLRLYEQEFKRAWDYIAELDYQWDEGVKLGRKEGLEAGLEKGLKKGLRAGKKKGLEKGLKEGRNEGLKEGLEKGREEKAHEMVRALLSAGDPVEKIAKITGLSIEQIELLGK